MPGKAVAAGRGVESAIGSIGERDMHDSFCFWLSGQAIEATPHHHTGRARLSEQRSRRRVVLGASEIKVASSHQMLHKYITDAPARRTL